MKVTYIILTCQKYIPTRCSAIRQTWLQDVEDYYFLSAEPDEENRVLGWNTPDDYESCSKKYIEFFRNVKLDSDWLVFCDDDTFVFTKRLESMLQTKNPADPLFIGYEFPDVEPPGGFSGGAGFVLSKYTYEKVCDYVNSTQDVWVSMYTDITVSTWLLVRIGGIQKVIDYRFHPYQCRNQSDFDNAFTFHYINPDQMKEYYSMMRELECDISILIPTMKSRERLFRQVLAEVERQIRKTPEIRVEVLWESDNGELTLGQKRNVLVDKCHGKYHCFIDDDDVISQDFIRTFIPMIKNGIDYDCASFVGAHYMKGKFNKLFHHSLDYPEWDERPDRFIRSVSPMNMIKTSIVREVRYKDIRNTEDHEFSKRLMNSGLLKTEFKIDPNRPIYHYIDGVKEDREEWTYVWNGNYITLSKPIPTSVFDRFVINQSTGNVVYPFLKTFRG